MFRNCRSKLSAPSIISLPIKDVLLLEKKKMYTTLKLLLSLGFIREKLKNSNVGYESNQKHRLTQFDENER